MGCLRTCEQVAQIVGHADGVEVRLGAEWPPEVAGRPRIAVLDEDEREDPGIGLVEGGADLLVSDGDRLRIVDPPLDLDEPKSTGSRLAALDA